MRKIFNLVEKLDKDTKKLAFFRLYYQILYRNPLFRFTYNELLKVYIGDFQSTHKGWSYERLEHRYDKTQNEFKATIVSDITFFKDGSRS